MVINSARAGAGTSVNPTGIVLPTFFHRTPGGGGLGWGGGEGVIVDDCEFGECLLGCFWVLLGRFPALGGGGSF